MSEKEEGLLEYPLTPDPSAPAAHFNWRLAHSGEELQSIYEYPLYTDARIIGHLANGCDPYQFLNAVAPPYMRRNRPSVILRADSYIAHEHYKMGEKTEAPSYHGGYLEDEIAALLSLSLGIRFKPGDANRFFDGADDCRGRPISRGIRLDPVLPQVLRAPLIPSATNKRNLAAARRICRLGVLTPQSASALIRAARLYQDAFWIVESEPHLSWLMFTSAIETAANQWLDEKEDPVDQLEMWGPGTKLVHLLQPAGGEGLVGEVAKILAPLTGARQGFLTFLENYTPDPPENRPPEPFQIPWSKPTLRKIFSQIYDYRSDALHAGTPFPAPMCIPPLPMPGNAHPEKPTGMATGMMRSTWVSKDLPMHIHVFEYIVRNALLAWWDELLGIERGNDVQPDRNDDKE